MFSRSAVEYRVVEHGLKLHWHSLSAVCLHRGKLWQRLLSGRNEESKHRVIVFPSTKLHCSKQEM